MHVSTFEYLKPTDEQIERMIIMRKAAAEYAAAIMANVPSGPDRTYIMRQFRECAMWCNVAITREADGMPRDD